MAFEIHFLTFVLVLKVVKYSGISRGKKRTEEREGKGEGKEITKICIFQFQKHQLPPMTIMRYVIHLGMCRAEKHKPQQVPVQRPHQKEKHIWWGLQSSYWLVPWSTSSLNKQKSYRQNYVVNGWIRYFVQYINIITYTYYCNPRTAGLVNIP